MVRIFVAADRRRGGTISDTSPLMNVLLQQNQLFTLRGKDAHGVAPQENRNQSTVMWELSEKRNALLGGANLDELRHEFAVKSCSAHTGEQ